LGGESGGGGAHVARHKGDLVWRRIFARAVEIARKCGRQKACVFACQRLLVDGGAAVERLRHLLHAARHAHVADAEFAHRAVHVGHEKIDDILRQARRARIRVALQAIEQEENVQCDRVEPAVQRIGHARDCVEIRVARLRRQGQIEKSGPLFGRVALEKPRKNHCRPNPFDLLPGLFH
jgi:hypothetical protein